MSCYYLSWIFSGYQDHLLHRDHRNRNRDRELEMEDARARDERERLSW